MKKIFTLLFALVMSTSLMADVADNWVGNWQGVLEVAMVSSTDGSTSSFDPTPTTIPITKNDDGTLNLSLENLILLAGGEKMYVGTVTLPNIKAANVLVVDTAVVLQDGTDPADATWMGSMVNTACGGSVPVSMLGGLNGNKMNLEINIKISKVLGYDVHCKFNALRYASQLPNADFEGTWTKHTKTGLLSAITYTEFTPESWHSFYDATGSVLSSAFFLANQLGKLSAVTGYDGMGYAAQITSQENAMKTISNGNLTNGVVNMGSIAADDTLNYNYSNISNTNTSLRFGVLPDSISAYVKFAPVSSTSRGSMTASLHGPYNYTDPETSMPADSVAKYKIAYASASIEPSSSWTRVCVPFSYNGNNDEVFYDTKYMLVSFSTNEKKGQGATGDILAIDHIRFVYNSKLKGLQIGGNDLEGFNPDTTSYNLKGAYNPDDFKAIPDGRGATTKIQFVDDRTVKITVYGADYLSNIDNTHTYTLTFETPVGLKKTQTAVEPEYVNVYTVDGVLLKKNVKASDALEGLSKGLYIVGHKVVAVK